MRFQIGENYEIINCGIERWDGHILKVKSFQEITPDCFRYAGKLTDTAEEIHFDERSDLADCLKPIKIKPHPMTSKPVGSKWIQANSKVHNADKIIQITNYAVENDWYSWVEPGTYNTGGFMTNSLFDLGLVPYDPEIDSKPDKKIKLEDLL